MVVRGDSRRREKAFFEVSNEIVGNERVKEETATKEHIDTKMQFLMPEMQ